MGGIPGKPMGNIGWGGTSDGLGPGELSGLLGVDRGDGIEVGNEDEGSNLNDHGRSGSVDDGGFIESILKLNAARGSCGRPIIPGNGKGTLVAGGELSS